jgi:hypothetical protein
LDGVAGSDVEILNESLSAEACARRNAAPSLRIGCAVEWM